VRERGPERLEVRAGVERPRVLVPGEHPRDGIGVVRPGGLLNAEEFKGVGRKASGVELKGVEGGRRNRGVAGGEKHTPGKKPRKSSRNEVHDANAVARGPA
jgi:hypothetical protein